MQRVIQLIKQDKLRLAALDCAAKLDLPQCYLAAGFVRNLVWDDLHGYTQSTPLNDIDVIYFDANETDPEKYKEYESILNACMPQLNWEVRNQAMMHQRNGDPAYESTLDAMGYWPEKETAVAVRRCASGELQCSAAFGIDSLFNLQLTYNPKRPHAVFKQRVESKGWLQRWPKLVVASAS